MNFTTQRDTSRPRGRMYHPRTLCPPKPAKLTSNMSNTSSPISIGVNVASSRIERASASVSAQNASKSSGAIPRER
jgi:hypothetical protein